MTLKDLTKCKNLKKRLERNKSMLEALRATNGLKAQVFTGTPHASGVSDTVGNFVVEIEDLEDQNRYLEKEIERTRHDMEGFIQTIEDEQLRTIFRLRSLHGITWGEVARTIGGNNTSSCVRMMCYRYLDAINTEG